MKQLTGKTKKRLNFDDMNTLTIPVKALIIENGKVVEVQRVQYLIEWGHPEEDIFSHTQRKRA